MGNTTTRCKFLVSDMIREMVREKKNKGLMEEKDYISEAYLQGGKAIGEIVTKKTGKKRR